MKKEENKKIKKVGGITWEDVEVLVVGAGTMGASIGQAYAQSGFRVGILDISEEILERALAAVDAELEAARKAGIFSDSQVQKIKKRILTTTSYERACGGRSLRLVIETATENLKIKKQIFRTLDQYCPPDVVLASNTSSLDINKLAGETNRPDKVVWMHYFYLPHRNRAGEYAGTEKASAESIRTAARYMKLAGKVATPILNSRKGGAADVIFVSLLLEAARMVDEGYDIPSIEAAGKKAFDMPVGFLGLMDATGIPIGIYTMYSFSDSSDPRDPLYKVYGNFFRPPESYKKILEKYQKTEEKSKVKWVSEEDARKEPRDLALVDELKKRFLAVGFVTATEVVEAGVIEMEEVDKLCQNAFLWREGPFALMNRIGIRQVLRMVKGRMELAQRQEIDFPLPELLISQAQKGEPWPLTQDPVVFGLEQEDRTARIMISNPRAANALDNRVFGSLKARFNQANEDKKVQVIVFDSAPIKTFIAGANVPDFVKNINQGNFEGIKEDTARWQEVIFHHMTGSGKPKIAIVDGAAFGGGVEVALAFALDPDSLVIATDRTSYTFPETRLGIYPGLRGTLTLAQAIYEATHDPELALALSRYYILAGGTSTSSPRLIKYLGLADFLVPVRKRDEAAAALSQAIMDNGGRPLTPQQRKSLNIEELPSELTFEEREEMRWMKDLFLKNDVVPTLYAYGRGQAEIFLSGESRIYAQRIARRVANNSPHAVFISDCLINHGFEGCLEGKSLDERAQWELDHFLIPTFQHPDALEGLSALTERRFPEFNRRYPL
ncbi:MAG: 3-hydroxyacyl-CoA dehydrogenase NAD-binding domain-containing protein [Candidatus Aminicenantes bacterium]